MADLVKSDFDHLRGSWFPEWMTEPPSAEAIRTRLGDPGIARRLFGVWLGPVLAGRFELTFRDDLEKPIAPEHAESAEVSYFVRHAFTNQGVASHAIVLLLEGVHCQLGIHRFTAQVDPRNRYSDYSTRVLEKAGFVRTVQLGGNEHFELLLRTTRAAA